MNPQAAKWLMLVALAAALGVFCTEVFAIRDEHTFEVSVSIPTSDFYVLPVNPQFLEREQRMAWNTLTSTLAPLRESFDVKNIAGGITARLGYAPVLSNGFTSFALDVSFNGQSLTLLDTTVVPAEQARVGLRVPLVISAVEPDGGYAAGHYFGSVQLIFDALRP